MSSCIKKLAFCLAIGIIFVAGSAQSKVKINDSLKTVVAASDSLLTRAARAITTRDTALLGSLLIEDISLIMPGEVQLEGRTKAMKYADLLMQTVGGSEVTFERLLVGFIPKYDNLVRDAGNFIVKATKTDAGVRQGLDFVGTYTFYFELIDGNWQLKRAFIDKKRGY